MFRSVAGQPINDADEPRHAAAATVYGNGNGMVETGHNTAINTEIKLNKLQLSVPLGSANR